LIGTIAALSLVARLIHRYRIRQSGGTPINGNLNQIAQKRCNSLQQGPAMPLSSAYRMGLQFFNLERDTTALRQEVWAVLGPRLGEFIERYWNECVINFAPFYVEQLKRRREEWRLHLIHQVRRLFEQPFDDDWVARCKERVDYEISVDVDMRARGTFNGNLLRYFNQVLRDDDTLSKQKAFELAEVAADVLALDAANAATLHYAAQVKSARAHAGRLRDVIQTFGESMEGSRGIMNTVAGALNDACSRLTQLTNAAAHQASTANQAVRGTARSVAATVAATEEFSAALSRVHEPGASTEAMIAAMATLDPQTGKTHDILLRVSEAANKAKIASLALQAMEDAIRSAQEAAQVSHSLSRNLSGSAREIGQSLDALLDITARCGIQPLTDLAKAS
jgi:hypothetical protein